jgi:tetratricopeptide (TPR) repeat protein
MTRRVADGPAARQAVAVPVSATGNYFANRPWLLALALMLITVAAYAPVWHAGFIWDDKELLIDNRMVKASDGLYRFWFTTEAPDYYPLTWSLCWLEWRAWGASAAGYHAVNLLLHSLNVVLLWLVLRRLQIPGAWLAALVFAIHPVNVATVGWVSEQKTTLSMLLYAATILLYLRFDDEQRWRWYGLSLAAFLLALLSKSAVVMLPFVLLGCVWWRRGSLGTKDLMRSLPFLACSLILGRVTVWFQYHQAMGGHTIRADDFLSRLVAAGCVPWFYLGKALLPINLTVVYPQWHMDASRWISYIPGMALVGCFALFWWKRKAWGRPWLFGLGYFVVTLFPVLGFLDQNFYRYSLVADHWQYYSIVGVIALAIGAAVTLCRRMGRWGRDVGALASVALLVTLGVATWSRARVYADSQTLWQDNVAKNPGASVARCSLGVVLSQSGRLQEAIIQLEQALRIQPDYADAHNDLGMALAQTGKIEEAIGHYEQALRIEPDNAKAHYNLGLALQQKGRVREAIGHYEQALQIDQQFAEVYNNLGVALAQAGKLNDAIGQYEQAVQIRPDYAEAHCNLGNLLLQTGNLEEGIAHLEQAVRLKPDYAEAHSNLGLALAQTGQTERAIAHFVQALRIQPDYADAHNNLGVALLQLGRVQEAIGHFEQALRIKPDYAEAHCALGIALEQAGRVREAIGHYERALRIKPDFTQAQNALARLQAGR